MTSKKIGRRLSYWLTAVVAAAMTMDVAGAAEKPKEDQKPTANALQTLSGAWRLAVDPQNKGRSERWFEQIRPEAKDAPVPGIIQQVFPAYHGVAWYWHAFRCRIARPPGDRVLIHFGAVDHVADVWINGKHAGSFEGGETPFEFDVTDSIREGDNLLAVRVINPTTTPIDGYVLGQTPHRNKTVPASFGSTFNFGGIMYPVQLRSVPPTYVTDVFARPNAKTGKVGVTVSVLNAGGAAVSGEIVVTISPAGGGETIASVQQPASFKAGTSEHELRLRVDEPRLWSLDDPYLYRVVATLTTAESRPHQTSVRCGFRDFRVKDGYFHLNGKRVFLKSTHTGNSVPIGQQLVVAGDFGRRDMMYAKMSGFNTVRFIGGVAFPEQLDFCDELGLMVYEECFAGWCLEDSPKMGERFDRNTAAMIRRDRNHPSVTLWGMLNETGDGTVFRQAVNFLPKLRKLDPTRLVLLNSGRFDQQWSIGSVSNPGSRTWDHVWGVEGPAKGKAAAGAGYPSLVGAGDFHLYPRTPQTPESDRFIRALGREGKPVLLSEYGIGSQMNVIDEWRHFDQVGARPDLEDAVMLRQQSVALAADWKRLGFEDVYPFPEDMLRESQRLHARQRTIGFNCIRSNPKICGYNLTGMLDHGMTGEGLWTYWRLWKPATFDAVSDGWSPLRWCLFVEPTHVYAGRSVTVDAVLANEDVLKPGDYPARFRVLGPAGAVWEKQAVAKLPDPPALAVPVIRETFKLSGPAGAYTFAAEMDRGAPTGGRSVFYVSDPAALPKLTGSVVTWGLEPKTTNWLTAHGLNCRQLGSSPPGKRDVILVGNPPNADNSPKLWADVKQRMEKGATVVFLSPQLFISSKAAIASLPLKNKGRCRTFNDWLYHKDCVAKRHPIFDGLQAPGVMDWDYYGPVIPHEIFEGQDTPDETIAASFATGYYEYPGGYGSGLLIAAYRSGEGRFILSTPRILENVDSHPAADRLLLNLISYARTPAARQPEQPGKRDTR